MKNLALCLFCVLLSHFSEAQCVNGTKSYPIYKTGAQLVSKLDEEGKEIVRIEYDLIFSSKETSRSLSSDWEYTIVAFADDGVKDLDLKIYEYDDLLNKWTLLKKDDATDRIALLTVKPPKFNQYKIEVIVHSFHTGYTAARYGLIIFHD